MLVLKSRIRVLVLPLFILMSIMGSLLQAQPATTIDELLTKGVQEMQQTNHTKSLEILHHVRKMAQTKGTEKQLFLALNNIGANHFMMLDYGEALKYYLEAYAIAVKDLTYTDENIVLNNIAILYSKDKKWDKAEVYFLKAYQNAVDNTDDTKMQLNAINLAQLYNEMGKYNLSYDYLIKAKKYADNSNEFPELALNFIEYYLAIGKYEDALQKALVIYDDTEYAAYKNLIGCKIATLYNLQGNYSLAKEYLDHITIKNLNTELKKDVYQQYFTLHLNENRHSVALLYQDSILQSVAELNTLRNTIDFETHQTKFELSEAKHALNEVQLKNTFHTRLIIALSSVLLLFIIVGILFFKLRKLRSQREKLLLLNSQEKTLIELEKQKNEKLSLLNDLKNQELERAKEELLLKQALEIKNKKLLTKALLFHQQKELVDDFLNVLQLTLNEEYNKKLNSHITKLKRFQIKEKESSNLFTHFEEVNQGFLLRLSKLHPNLNSNDIRFLSYIYMNLNIKEISILLNITLEASRKRKERIIKKLGIGEQDDFYFYIRSI